jgi:predicted dehydrogenase
VKEIGVGLIGCGNISSIYLTNIPSIPGAFVRACADLRPELAEAQGRKFNVEAMPVDTLLARDDIDIVVNLTVPVAHSAVSLAVLSAGKHVFSEKPLATDVELGRKVVAEADQRGLLVGCAPDTFLGAGGRLARRLIDEGAVGRVLLGTSIFMTHGMEHWHPDPEFFFKPGGGPVLDVGPYYLTALVNLLGPVARVLSATSTGIPERIVTAEGPRKGHRIAVETPTTALAILEFVSGAQVLFGASWEVWRHGHPLIELYGLEGSMRVPDPNFFGGVVETTEGGGEWTPHDTAAMSLGAVNWPADKPRVANYRALGVAEMASALRNRTKQRASGRLALHVLETMEAIVKGGTAGASTAISSVERPPKLDDEEAATLFAS